MVVPVMATTGGDMLLYDASNSNSLLYQQPPVPGRWGYYDRENLTKKLN